MSEIQRLKALLPDKLHSKVAIVRSADIKSSLIATEKAGSDRYAVRIDLIRWEQFPQAQRDLLFWHEVARIQFGTVVSFPWELLVFSGGLGFSLIELVSQNLLLFAIALVVTGLAGNQLYQRNRGERALREATAADQGAIALATRFGYPLKTAYFALHDALNLLAQEATRSSLKHRYEARLQVLAISAREHDIYDQETPLNPSQVAASKRRNDIVASLAARELKLMN